jgi:hypothetical protein
MNTLRAVHAVDDRRRLVTAMRSFIVMYRPHAAREDADLFPKPGQFDILTIMA